MDIVMMTMMTYLLIMMLVDDLEKHQDGLTYNGLGVLQLGQEGQHEGGRVAQGL